MFELLGKEKLGVPQNENVSLVLESDGTQVEDGEYFKTLANNTILLLLRHGERWCPTGVDIIRAGTYPRRSARVSGIAGESGAVHARFTVGLTGVGHLNLGTVSVLGNRWKRV